MSIRHMNNASEKLKAAHKLLGLTNVLSNELSEVLNYWTRIKITDKHVKHLIQMAMAPNSETLQNVIAGKKFLFTSKF